MMGATGRNRRRGKDTERAVAGILGGERRGLLGRDDVRAGRFSVEVKSRERFSGEGFMDQAVRNCPEGMTPVVVVHVHRQRHGQDLVMLRVSDFIKLVEEGSGGAGRP